MISNLIQNNPHIINKKLKQIAFSSKVPVYNFVTETNPDVFFKNHTNITFQGKESPDRATLYYIKKTREDYYKKHGRELDDLKYFELNKISDICKGISIFKDWNATDLAILATNFESFLLQRGCSHQCTHCGACSQHKITTVNWENFIEFTEAAGELKNRLGFNPLMNKRYMPHYFMPFNDSEPMHFSSYDTKGKRHNIYDVAKEFYKKTNTPTMITTAGWEKSNENAQKAAEKFVKHPEFLSGFEISIHPFHSYLARSRKYEKQGNIEKAQYWRDKYVNMMANVIKTTKSLKFNLSDYYITLEYTDDKINPSCNKQEMYELFRDITDKLEYDGIKLDMHFIMSHSNFSNPLPIGLIGRAKSLEEEDMSDRYFPIDVINKYSSHTDKLEERFNRFDKAEILHAPKIINTDGSILIKKKANGLIDVDFAKLPLKLHFSNPTNWKSDYEYAEIPKGLIPQKNDIKQGIKPDKSILDWFQDPFK